MSQSKHTPQCGCIEYCPLHEFAPELLDACQSAIREIEAACRLTASNTKTNTALIKLRTAIAKATGETNGA